MLLTTFRCVNTISKNHLRREQAKTRSGYSANKDRKNLVAPWNWGRRFLTGFPVKQNPFQAVDKFPEERRPRYIPPEEDFWKILDVVDDEQNRVMLLTFLYTAARRSEVFNLTWSGVDFGTSQIRLWTRKREGGHREPDWFPMNTELRTALHGWWENRPIKDHTHVFLCLDETAYCEEYYGKPFKWRGHMMKRLCEKAKVKPFGFHAIRHLTASVLYAQGNSVSVIQSVLRHRNPNTTAKYLHSLGLEETRNALEGLGRPNKVIPFPRKAANESR